MKRILFALLSALLTLGTHATFAAPQSGSVVEWGFEVLPAINANTQFESIYAGDESGFAVSTGGKLYGWRWNEYGEIPPLNQASNIVAVSADTFTLALTKNGTILAWGDDSEGGTDVPPGLSNVVAVSAMSGHGLALKADGTVAAWGDNFCGESDVPPGLSNIIAVAAGVCESYLLKSDGTVLYLGNYTNAIVNGVSNVISIASANYDLYSVESDGILIHSQLSDAAVFASAVVAGISNIVAVSDGYGCTLALQSDGTVWSVINGLQSIFKGAKAVAVGGNDDGGAYALGTNGSVIQFGNNFAPMQAPWAYTRNITTLPVGGDDLVPSPNGTVICLDDNDAGQPFAGWSNVAAVATGYEFSLALETNGTVLAFGYDDSDGQTDVPTNLTGVAAIAAGGYHSLALLTNGTVVGWGYDEYGQANGSEAGTGIAAISAGALHSLALTSNGTVVAWGANDYGQCDLPGGGLNNMMAIAAGGAHNLALQSNGTVVAWGYNEAGQCDVPVGLTNVVAIAAGGDHSLALQADGTVVAWGDNTAGENTVPSGLGPVIAISAGETDSMALVLPASPTLQQQLAAEGLVLSWPSVYSGFTLQSSPGLSPADWENWPGTPANDFGEYWVTNPISIGSQFFRLKK